MELSDEIDRGLRGNYPLQLTGGTDDERRALIQQHYPTPILDADAEHVDDYDSLAKTIATNIWPSDLGRPDDSNQRDPWSEIEHHLTVQDGTIAIYNFDALDDETARTTSQRLKGLYEQTDAAIAITAGDDHGAIFRANPDLRGRIRTIHLDE